METPRQSDKLLNTIKKIHMIGIGGSGMCPLAEVLHAKGYTVSGSDNTETEKTMHLRDLGITVSIGQRPENIEGAELVAFSAAISENNPERKAAEQNGIPTMERSVLLGALTRQYNNCIGVAGTHGKTTVSSIITQILLLNKREPTAVIGGVLPIARSSAVIGNSDILVCESCEFVNSFLEFSPAVSVLLNIDNDHLDFFGNMENLARSFREFVSLSKTAYVNGDQELCLNTVSGLDTKIITFGRENSNDFYAGNIKMGKYGYCFDVYKQNEKIGSLEMHIPGEHNIYNGLVSFAVCYDLGVSPEGIADAVSKFTGAGRRFENHGTFKGITVIDDYAHHPTEIEATIKAAKSLTNGKVTVVFQPFTYSRVVLLKDGMIKALSHADKVFLTPIVASREENIYGVSSDDIANALPDAEVIDNYEILTSKMIDSAEDGDILITMGAGDIYKVAERIAGKLNENG